MSTLTWVLIGVFVYWVGITLLDRRGVLPSQINVSGPIITIHTQRGRAFLDRVAQYRRFWRAWANIGVGIALVVMIAAFLFLFSSALSVLRNPQPTGISQPRNVLVIPGVNDFLPLSVAPEIAVGLVIGLIVHEGGHGLLCRVGNIDIDSMGVALFAILPVGAFVQPDEESQEAADRGDKTRMFAAGVTNNFAITVVAFLLLFGPVAGSIAVAPGAAVGGSLQGSGAADAGIDQGDRIVEVNGQAIDSNTELEALLDNSTEQTVTVELDDERQRTVERSVLVTGNTSGSPATIGTNSTIQTVNGTPVSTTAGVYEAAASSDMLSVETNDGQAVTFPAGAFVTIQEEGAIAESLAPGSQAVITQIDDTRIRTGEELGETLSDRDPGTTVSVVAYIDGSQESYTVELGGETDGRLGVLVQPGLTGLELNDFGARYYPAELYLSLLGGDQQEELNPAIADTFIGKALFTLFLPIAGIVDGQTLPYNFAGFTGEIQNFFTVEGPLSLFGGSIFVLANVLFWIGWLNINLGFFNCIPAFPLDGGHILRASTEAVVSRLPLEGSYELTKAVTVTIGLTMFGSFLLIVFGPQLLG